MVIRWVLFPALLAGFTAASAWSIRLAFADYWFGKQTVQGTERALAWTPGQADCYVRLAFLTSSENRLTATEALQRAVALNPSDARSWIELGLRYEKEGNRMLAEQCLLRAAEEDRQYLPRWTLTNYYFRETAINRFWFWAEKAAGMAYGDASPLFRLCGQVVEDGALIDRLNIRRPDLRAAYLSYLLSRNRLDLIRPASRHLLQGARATDVPLLLAVCDQLLESKNAASALETWNGLAAKHRIPFRPLQPAGGDVLTNGDFRVAATLHGFDWRLPAIDGVSASTDDRGGLRLTFSGRQPENCEPLVQFVPVQENTDYQLKFEYWTSGIAAGSGLEWRITDWNGDKSLVDAHGRYTERDGSGKVVFVTPAGCHLARLALAYKRLPGTTRMEGFIVLRKVSAR
jgi:tetratricopeptide (TPR) repeat protein